MDYKEKGEKMKINKSWYMLIVFFTCEAVLSFISFLLLYGLADPSGVNSFREKQICFIMWIVMLGVFAYGGYRMTVYTERLEEKIRTMEKAKQ